MIVVTSWLNNRRRRETVCKTPKYRLVYHFQQRTYTNKLTSYSTMKNSIVKPKLTALATAVLLSCSILFLHSNARAQCPCGPCDLLYVYDTGYQPMLACACNGECISMCQYTSYWSFSLDPLAKCTIDTVAVTPPAGVCWAGCMAIQEACDTCQFPWAYGIPINHATCNSGNGYFSGIPTPSSYLAPGGTLYFQVCSSESGGETWTFTFYWADGSTCVVNETF
jgi:hypothetical protein